MTPALVIFDLDGVLVDSEILAARAVAEVAAGWGVRLDTKQVLTRFVGLTDEHIGRKLSDEEGAPLPDDFADRVHRHAMGLIERELEAVPGAQATLERLALARCVASNSRPDRVESSLTAAGLRHHFADDALFSAKLVGRAKPAPDLHLHAAAAMAVAPGEAVVIEDSETGVQAAVAAGMAVLGFVGAGHVTDPDGQAARLRAAGAEQVVDDLNVLPELLASR